MTGASSGLGKAAAILFADKGWKVIASMRDPSKEQELIKYANISLLTLDVTNPVEIEQAAKQALAQGDVAVVFNNAGYGLAGPLESTTDAQIVRQLDTNLLGVIRVTQAFIPAFRARKAGLFITTTSIGGLITFPFNSVYHATKWALEGWSESMAFELSKFGIGIKTVSPGGIKTDFMSRSMTLTQHPAYAEHTAKVLARFTDPARRAVGSTAEEIAAVVYEAATDGKDQLRYVAGRDAQGLYAQRKQAGDEQFRKAVDKEFFG